MKKSRLLNVIYAFSLAIATNEINAAAVSSIKGLDIGGTTYDVNFHSLTTFQALWDNDGDKTFGDGDGSVFNTAPTFWGDPDMAELAASQIMNYLGSTHTVNGGGDAFYVPFEWGPFTTVTIAGDAHPAPETEIFTTTSGVDYESVTAGGFASFTVTAIPVPAAIWLFGSGLLGLAGISRHQKSTS